MVALKKYNLKGEEVGDIEFDDQFLDVNVNHQLIKDYLVALRANARQWSASTKTRSEVSHTTKKPFKQKGTGNARQGSLVSPQFRGGGIVFGPKPKFDQRIRINKKEKRMAIRHLLAEKIKGQNVIVVEDAVFGGALKKPKTQEVVAFLKNRSVVGKRLLFVGGSHIQDEKNDEQPVKYQNFKLSVRNLPRTQFDEALNLNGYNIVVAHKIIITESALAEIRQMFV